MASPTKWTWVWSRSGSWWWTGKPGMLQSTESQRVGHDWATKLNWRGELIIILTNISSSFTGSYRLLSCSFLHSIFLCVTILCNFLCLCSVLLKLQNPSFFFWCLSPGVWGWCAGLCPYPLDRGCDCFYCDPSLPWILRGVSHCSLFVTALSGVESAPWLVE